MKNWPGIQRIETDKCGYMHGWQARVVNWDRSNRRCYTRYYADNEHGGRVKAFNRAKDWLLDEYEQLGIDYPVPNGHKGVALREAWRKRKGI